MAETLSPNPKQRLLQSPTSPFFLGSNDDHLERAQARAARAAKVRRISVVSPPPRGASDSDKFLGKHQILDLFRNCIKLASENKINQKNTWELNLIDHLTEVIKVEEEDDAETNFQKASCTLEAGVKIYSLRVDSVHSEAYKVLGGMNRAGQENEQDATENDANVDIGQEEGHSKKETERKLSPLSTLESSFEALNVKKFDVAFAVDPLYHQTSAQFDEGGAKGLLMNNLGVYGGCRVLFDSLEIPGKCTSCENQHDKSDTIDLSFAKEYVEQMVLNMRREEEISPTLRDMENEPFSFEPNMDDRFEKVDGYLFLSLGLTKQNAWAGPDHWKYKKSKGLEDDPAAKNESPVITKRPRNKKQAESDIDFTKALDEVMPDVFAPPKNPKSLLLPGNRAPSNIKLPEDCHYQPEDLVKLFLLPNVKCLGGKGRKCSDVSRQQCDDYGPLPSWDDDSAFGGQNDDGNDHSDVEDSSTLVSQPRQVNKVEVQYDKTSKQVDVQALKETLWDHIQESPNMCPQGLQEVASFRQILASFPTDCKAAATISDISPHLCFICLLHLANEHGLSIHGNSNLDDLTSLNAFSWRAYIYIWYFEKGLQEVASFRQILASFPTDCKAAATISDISPHLCFICLLHLANEHGLSIHGNSNLDDLSIHLSS
ncbi:condensin complex subunit 2 [Quercus suber]|uniref:Condensin complex subunit 2 n=1 Tax=Quercus suber TaxID=58331 RepID=A0AAW0KK44_QUESU